MKTDEFFYEVFRFDPGILSLLLDLQNHGKYRFDSITQKHTQKSLDGIFRSAQKNDPNLFLEVQGYQDDKVNWRLFRQICMYYEMNDDEKNFVAVLIVLDKSRLPKEFPLQCKAPNRLVMVKLEKLLEPWEGKAGTFTVFKPFCLENKEELPKKSEQWVQEIRSLNLPKAQEQKLLEFLEYSIVQKFSKLTLKEVKQMIHLVPLEQTVAGQELIQIGREEIGKQWQDEKEQWQVAEGQWQEEKGQWQEEKGQWQVAEEQWKEEKRGIARNLKAAGVDVKMISETTGLSLEEIDSL